MSNTTTVIRYLTGNLLLRTLKESSQYANGVRKESGIERSPNRSRDRSGVRAHYRDRLQLVLDRVTDDANVKRLKRGWTRLADVSGNRCSLGRRVGDAKQTEGPVYRRIGQMKLQLLEGGAQHGVQNNQSQNLLSRESIAAKSDRTPSAVRSEMTCSSSSGMVSRIADIEASRRAVCGEQKE